MATTKEQWVPKVHPTTREVEPEDPMELIATPVQGDPEVMLECFLQEFAWMGWDAEQLMALFRDPGYPVLNQLLEHYGEPSIRERIRSLLGSAVLRFSERIVEEPEPQEEHELIQLSFRKVVNQ
jgi:hypothetical protein